MTDSADVVRRSGDRRSSFRLVSERFSLKLTRNTDYKLASETASTIRQPPHSHVSRPEFGLRSMMQCIFGIASLRSQCRQGCDKVYLQEYLYRSLQLHPHLINDIRLKVIHTSKPVSRPRSDLVDSPIRGYLIDPHQLQAFHPLRSLLASVCRGFSYRFVLVTLVFGVLRRGSGWLCVVRDADNRFIDIEFPSITGNLLLATLQNVLW